MKDLLKKPKLLLVGGLGIVVLLLALTVYVLTAGFPKIPSVPSMNQKEGSEKQSISASLKELLGKGQNFTCTFVTKDVSGDTEGQISFVEGGKKFSGEFTLTDATGKKQTNHMVRNEEFTFIWGTAMEKGIKIKNQPNSDDLFPESPDPNNSLPSIDEQRKVDYSCQPFTANNESFTPPSNVEFVDFAAQMEQFGKLPGMDAKTAPPANPNLLNEIKDCSVCNQADTTERQTCRSALGCSN